MLAIINSCSLLGVDAYLVSVEVDVSKGMPAFDIVGLPDAAVRESRERVRTAIRNSGLDFPYERITVNLAPADVKKEGANFDLPIAVGILLATGQIPEERSVASMATGQIPEERSVASMATGQIPEERSAVACNAAGGPPKQSLARAALVGELSLDGSLRRVNGVLPMSCILPEHEISSFILPQTNAAEGALLGRTEVWGLNSLRQFVDWWRGGLDIEPTSVDVDEIFRRSAGAAGQPDMADVKGQQMVKRALEIAAAGRHNLLMVGSPGSGKTMLARRLPSILPDLTLAESLESTRIYSICGLLPEDKPLVIERPFRAPHHTSSAQSVIGGGRVPKPGEVSLAHNGVLFLDELPEFGRAVRESLRQPLEDKVVTVSRVQGRMDFDASFQLIAAMNPCPCGFLGDPVKPCTCTPHQVSRYLGRVSGPLLDRIDLQVSVQRVEFADLNDGARPESSADIKARVTAARQIQLRRFAAEVEAGQEQRIFANADMTRAQLEKYCKMQPEAEKLLEKAFARLNLSARAHDRLLKVARTIADLAGSELIEAAHIAEAVQYRGLEKFAEYK